MQLIELCCSQVVKKRKNNYKQREFLRIIVGKTETLIHRLQYLCCLSGEKVSQKNKILIMSGTLVCIAIITVEIFETQLHPWGRREGAFNRVDRFNFGFYFNKLYLMINRRKGSSINDSN